MRLSLGILGTDPVAIRLADTLAEHTDRPIGLIGRPPSPELWDHWDRLREQGEDLRRALPFDDDALRAEPLREDLERLRERLAHVGGRAVDLEEQEHGLSLLVQRDETLTTLHCAELWVSAPPGPDLTHRGYVWPGVDSVPTGLLIDRLDLDVSASPRFDAITVGGVERLWRVEFGIRSGPDGSTDHPDCRVFGAAAGGFPDPDPLRTVLEDPPFLPSPPADATDPFADRGWEDTSMPEGFVATKTGTLKSLMDTIFFERDARSERLVQTFEGLVGEIDSYSRFRPEAELLRLRWKTLTAMNVARPFLLLDSTPHG